MRHKQNLTKIYVTKHKCRSQIQTEISYFCPIHAHIQFIWTKSPPSKSQDKSIIYILIFMQNLVLLSLLNVVGIIFTTSQNFNMCDNMKKTEATKKYLVICKTKGKYLLPNQKLQSHVHVGVTNFMVCGLRENLFKNFKIKKK